MLAALALAAFLAIPSVNVRAQDVNLDEIFRCMATDAEGQAICAEGRDLVLSNCTLCHTFVPIVLQRFDENGWTGLLDRHRDRVPQLGDEQIDTIRSYLAANFNGELEPPELPEELLATWTDY